MAKYRLLTGLDYGSRSVDAGQIVEDIPAKSIKWLRDQNLIEQVDAKGAHVSADPVEDEE